MDDANIPAHPEPPRSHWRRLWWLLPLLAVLLLSAALWQLRQTDHAARQALSLSRSQSERISTLQDALGNLQQERAGLNQRMDDAAAVNRSLREELLGLRERTRTLEDALAGLAESRNGGTQALRLDEAEFLLRMAQERYSLFHDAAGALDATRLAAQALNGVDAPVYAPLRSEVAGAITALEQLHPAARAAQLSTLAALRAEVWQLPLAPNTRAPSAQAGILTRIGHALAGLVRIRRIDQAPLSGAGADLLHEMLALDLAQAQTALLAWDGSTYQSSLADARALLQARFDQTTAAAQSFRAQLDALKPLAKTPLPQLDATLTELRRLRALETLRTPPPVAPVKGVRR
jgi:uroporphyrin-3 C-methyltransferase